MGMGVRLRYLGWYCIASGERRYVVAWHSMINQVSEIHEGNLVLQELLN